jgi:DNA polymerase I-like protein with 3'-5' exonuclease and polymerase domains
MLHPAGVLRQYQTRPNCIFDLMKAKIQCEFPQLKLPRREIMINPTIQEVEAQCWQMIEEHQVACDIETLPEKRLITMIGFAWSATQSIVIPFCDKKCVSYWSKSEEIRALKAVRRVLLKHPHLIAQNASYEMQWLWKILGIPTYFADDTMLMHHALQPEMRKSLEFMASIQCELPYWKDWSKKTGNKRDE